MMASSTQNEGGEATAINSSTLPPCGSPSSIGSTARPNSSHVPTNAEDQFPFRMDNTFPAKSEVSFNCESLRDSNLTRRTDTEILDDADAKEAVGPTSEDQNQKKVAKLWHTLDVQLRVNIGTSVKCGICLCTLTNPVRTHCVHSFCKSCILESLKSNKTCPECKSPLSKRQLQPFVYLEQMASAYKDLLKEFGFSPGKFHANFTTLTQKVCCESDEEEDEEAAERDDSDQSKLDRLCVAKSWQHHALPHCQDTKSIQRQENDQVVAANADDCSGLALQGYMDRSKPVKNIFVANAEGIELKMSIPQNQAGETRKDQKALPTTQEVEDQIREQIAADQDLRESFEEINDMDLVHSKMSGSNLNCGREEQEECEIHSIGEGEGESTGKQSGAGIIASQGLSVPAIASSPVDLFSCGDVVEVEARTWPGVNKPGGVARVASINEDGTFNVAYVLGGKETGVEPSFLSRATEFASNTSEEAPVAARRRRRPRDELPEDLLRQLAKEGFDTGCVSGVKSSGKRKKRKDGKKIILADSTNERPASEIAYDGLKECPAPDESNNSSDDPEILMSNDEAIQLTKGAYEARFGTAFDNKLVLVAATGLSDGNMELLKALCGRSFDSGVRIKVSNDVDENTTLVVVPADTVASGIVEARIRSLKAMKSALLGVPMTVPGWLQDCENSNSILVPSVFVNSLPTKAKSAQVDAAIQQLGLTVCGVSRLAANLEMIPSVCLFSNYFVCLFKNATSIKNTLNQLLKAGGGTVVPSPSTLLAKIGGIGNDKKCNFVLVCGDLSTPFEKLLPKSTRTDEKLKFVSVVTSEWVFESVACGKALPVSLFAV